LPDERMRFVKPYWCNYETFTKGRWLGRKLKDVFLHEFHGFSEKYLKAACKLNRIIVNHKPVLDIDYILQNGDHIIHRVHRHEHPVLPKPIQIIENSDDLLVINKPASIPVHPCGKYKYNSITEMLKELGFSDLRVVHRLDRTTSGLLIFAKNYEVVCEEPLGPLICNLGIHCVRKDGKVAKTRFRRISTDGKTSIVRCFLETGRTHQIRIHLQFLGFPIFDDYIYNSKAWGPFKGKGGVFGKSLNELSKDVSEEHQASFWQEPPNPQYESKMDSDIDPLYDPTHDSDIYPLYDPLCLHCNIKRRLESPGYFMIHLHCFKYETSNWSFSSELPEWTKQSTDCSENTEKKNQIQINRKSL
uniref:S4 RNA-binding domain-containing protein n=1 Tax=Dracunculus medinensis TaxID=318479 RepID=A0A0N4US34_DRAME